MKTVSVESFSQRKKDSHAALFLIWISYGSVPELTTSNDVPLKRTTRAVRVVVVDVDERSGMAISEM